MNEPLSEVIRIRVTPAQAMRLQQAAALAGLSFSDYLRRRLTHADALADELALLRQAIQQLEGLSITRAAAVEAALLARRQARPEHLSATQTDMQALGVNPMGGTI